MKFQIRRSSSYTSPFYWRIVAGNGQVLATSETYTSKQAAVDAANSVRRHASGASLDDLT